MMKEMWKDIKWWITHRTGLKVVMLFLLVYFIVAPYWASGIGWHIGASIMVFLCTINLIITSLQEGYMMRLEKELKDLEKTAKQIRKINELNKLLEEAKNKRHDN